MKLQDAAHLIEHPLLRQQENARWVDLGCGNGFFTFALAQLLPRGSSIEAIDRRPVVLQSLPNPQHIAISRQQFDFTQQPLPFHDLTGLLMANSLHYVQDKPAFIAQMKEHLGKQGCWLIVEYDTDKPNPWVPYPLSFRSLEKLFAAAGYPPPEKLKEMPSAYNTGKLYAALVRSRLP